MHYTAALFAYRGLPGLLNSVIVASATTVLSGLLGTLHGLQLRALQHRRRHLAFWVLSQRFLPPVAIVLPIFLLYRNFGLYDTRAGLVLVYTVFTLPLSSWLMYAYFRHVPRELEDAALVDGASRWQAFWRVAVPLAAPGIAAAAVFAFIAVWTEFFFALILTSRLCLHPADGVSRLPRLSGRAIRRIQRAGGHLAGAVDRAWHAGATSSGARADAWRDPRVTERTKEWRMSR